MKKLSIALSIVYLSTLYAAHAAAPPIDDALKTILKDCQPIWMPTDKPLHGWIIGIDPSPAGISTTDQRLADDLSMTTAAHLYHFVKRAGGRAILTRADETLSGSPNDRIMDQQIETLRRVHCDLCISIRYSSTAGKVIIRPVPTRSDSNATELSAALVTALDAELLANDKTITTPPSLIDRITKESWAEHIALSEICFIIPAGLTQTDSPARKTCFNNARLLYDALADFCSQNTPRSTTDDRQASIPYYPDTKPRDKDAAFARAIWPAGPLPAEHLNWFCRRYAKTALTNPSLVYFNVTTKLAGDTVVLTGKTNTPDVADGLQNTLNAAGFVNVRNEVQSLPDRVNLGQYLYGICHVPSALTYAKPDTTAGLQSQLLFGEPLFLLDKADGYYLLHAGDGYWGWVNQNAVQPVTAEQFTRYMRAPRAVALADIEDPRLRIPRGSELRLRQTNNNTTIVCFPPDIEIEVPPNSLNLLGSGCAQATQRIQAALTMLYVPLHLRWLLALGVGL